MLSYAISTATNYFHLPVDEEEDKDIQNYRRRTIAWVSEPSSTAASSPILQQILINDDLYQVLGISKSDATDKITLRRAYLARSKACHPDKFPSDPEHATKAFQKVSIAYDVLSNPTSKRLYDSRSPSSSYDVFAARPAGHADDTFRGVVIGVFNDFLDGDIEVIRTMLKSLNDLNPSLNLGELSIDAVVVTLQSIRERALTCRTCIYTLHTELSRLLEVQAELRSLSYLDLFGRSRLTIQLTRIAIQLPLAIDEAIKEQHLIYTPGTPKTHPISILPRHLYVLIRSVDNILARMERICKR